MEPYCWLYNPMNRILQRAGRRALGGVLLLVWFVPALTFFVPVGEAQAAVADWQKGVTIYPSSSSDFGSSGFQQKVQHLKSLGVNTITLIIPLYQNTNDTNMQSGWNTPDDASLISAIQYVHGQGLQVMLKPHVDPYDGTWRAWINPGDKNAWMSNYQNFMLKYANIAQQNGVEWICIGTELVSMTNVENDQNNTTRWQNLISAIRGVYHGKLMYDANWGGGDFITEANHIEFWGSLDAIGISAYYELGGDNSVQNLMNDWDQLNNSAIKPLEQQWGKPVIFSEVGYRSVSNAHNQPWNSWQSGGYDPQEQVNDYQALFQYWNNQSSMQGFDIWYENTDPNGGGSGNTDYLINGKPVEQTLSQWFQNPTAPAQSGTNQQSGPAAAFNISGSASPSTPTVGQSTTLTVALTNSGGAVSGANVDLEVYSGSSQAFQQTFTGQDFASGQTRTLTTNWTPGAAGTYALKVGAFSSDWKTLYTWNDAAATITVSGSSQGSSNNPPPPPQSTSTPQSGGSTSTSTTATSTTSTDSQAGGNQPASPAATNIWWPADGANVSGLQPFKAMLENMPTSQYQMYWQVDGDRLNQMFDSTTDWPHKEAQVDLSTWNWNSGGPYNVTFISKDGSGNVIDQKSVNIYVAH